jgi:hypothetical protein
MVQDIPSELQAFLDTLAPATEPEPASPPGPAPAPAPYTWNPHIAWDRLTADNRVVRGPVLFGGALLTSDGVGAAAATFYDGMNASGRRLFRLNAPSAETKEVIFTAPILLTVGLFIDVGANVEDVFALFSPQWE